MLSHYRLTEKIGEGGMGVVWKAVDARLNRQVAIKILPPELTADPSRRLRFQREARAAAAVSHPNIATIHEIGEDGAVDFIVMELIEGKSLRLLLSPGPLPVQEAMCLAAEIAAGLSEAHQAGVVHRDLKPENIIVDTRGHAKILDFGLAKLLEETPDGQRSSMSERVTRTGELTQEGTVLGTVPYMSPEQIRGESLDSRSDIFSFGTLLYEMLTGTRPFEGRTSVDTMSAVLRDEPRPVLELNPNIPPELGALVLKCLEKDPQRRYQAAHDLKEDLERLRSISEATPSSPLPRRPRPSISRLYRWFLPVTAVVAIASMALLIWLGSGSLRRLWQGASPDVRITSLAVLPLENISGSKEQEYFADGMTDTLIDVLSRIGALTVISRTSSMQYKDTHKRLPEIARELGVDAVVEGSVMRVGDRVRISAQLIHAASDKHLWGESYERDLRDVLRLQSEVAKAIAEQIQIKMTSREQARLSSTAVVNPASYQLCLKGRYYLNKYSEDGFKKALDCFRQALDVDSGCALAYAGLADTYYEMSSVRMNPEEAIPKARAAVQKALAIDDGLAEAHTTLAVITSVYDRDWDAAERLFREVIDLTPQSSVAHNRYGILLLSLGRLKEARVELNLASRLDPLSPYVAVGVAFPFLYVPPASRQYEVALQKINQALELDPNFVYARFCRALIYEKTGSSDDAIEEMEGAVALSGGWTHILGGMGRLYAVAGERSRAETLLSSLIEREKHGYVSYWSVAVIYAGLGDRDKAFAWLEKAVDRRDEELTYARGDPNLDSLRSDPRFERLLRKMKLSS